MSSINLHTDEVSIKIVYYGPGLGGKTTSLQSIHHSLRSDNRGQMISLATGIDRTLYFDFLPVKLPKIRGFTVRMSLYTVPGQVHYNATRKLVLQGADGVVFVADSQPERRDANLESMDNLWDNLRSHGMNPETVPLVLQHNKRDIAGAMPVEKMDRDLNRRGVPSFPTCAVTGKGLFDSLKTITKLVLADLRVKGLYGEQKKTKEPSGPQSGAGAATAASPPSGEWEIGTTDGETEKSGLAQAIEAHVELGARESAAELPAAGEEQAEPGMVTLSDLWEPGENREEIAAIEESIAIGDNIAAVERAERLLEKRVTAVAGAGSTLAEALLALGVHGAHYVRFRDAVSQPAPSRQHALLCLFFLTDIELRIQATRSRVVG
jgi:mutual gliding-motility protein MglA